MCGYVCAWVPVALDSVLELLSILLSTLSTDTDLLLRRLVFCFMAVTVEDEAHRE